MITTLTDQHLEQYRTDGYTLIRQLVPAELVSRVRRRILEVIADPTPWPSNTFQWIDPARYRHANGLPIPGGAQRPALQEALFDEMARHPALVAAMSRLLGGAVDLFTDQIGYRYSGIKEDQGGRSYYHQDSSYWKIAPELGCNAWFPLDPVDRQAGALPIMPGSQRGWQILPHEEYLDDPAIGTARDHHGEGFRSFPRLRIPDSQIDYSREVLYPMQPGDVLFFTNYTWHRSEPNRTGHDQLIYAIAYQLTKEAVTARNSQ